MNSHSLGMRCAGDKEWKERTARLAELHQSVFLDPYELSNVLAHRLPGKTVDGALRMWLAQQQGPHFLPVLASLPDCGLDWRMLLEYDDELPLLIIRPLCGAESGHAPGDNAHLSPEAILGRHLSAATTSTATFLLASPGPALAWGRFFLSFIRVLVHRHIRRLGPAIVAGVGVASSR